MSAATIVRFLSPRGLGLPPQRDASSSPELGEHAVYGSGGDDWSPDDLLADAAAIDAGTLASSPEAEAIAADLLTAAEAMEA